MVVHTGSTACSESAAIVRRAVAEATHHAAHRDAFGRLLAEQPLMQNVLADLCLDSEAATTTALRLARAFDEGDHAFRRLAAAVAKYWVCKATRPSSPRRSNASAAAASRSRAFRRLFRESPLNSIWEGSGNVNCLDVLRALERREREPGGVPRRARARPWCQPAPRRCPRTARTEALGPDDAEPVAERLVEGMALCLQGSLLVRHAPRRSPTPSAPPGSETRAGAPCGRSRAASTRPRSWNVTARGSGSVLGVRVEIFYCPV